MEKFCSGCGGNRPISEFTKNASNTDGLHDVCRTHKAAHQRAWYKKAAPTHKRNVAARKMRVTRENKAKIIAYLETHGCVDCSESDIVVLEFDHVRGKKRLSVSKLVEHGASWATIEAEIAKCEVRCCNCHRKRTAEVGNHYRAVAKRFKASDS